ncbi:glycosyltransferase family 4 protein [Chitinophaga nivalis]|uniref:Glycosyltransferase family 4 protein n=1 Tax=Chitinophaga nivalis TaxID=2991709 RepID=A0ABT3INV2_9BACT|nr:glycosyltransferase family 4 protein [Chitinophaga nivalis]MCW3464664.1 glycosyltransferase family 4 protein [Chitinophaga nivalis]MCW3485645.1 glycosyltransferase family 4 protein [Chitinophaga nivalis]
MKNVLILSYEFPPIIGGAGVYAHDLAIGLVKNGHRVSLLTYRSPENTDFLKRFAQQYQVTCYTIPNQKYLHFYLFFRQLKKLVKQQHYDTIIFSDARSKKMGTFFQASLKQLLSRSVSIFHGGEQNSFFDKPSFLLRTFGMKDKMLQFFMQQKKIVVVSRAEHEMWNKTSLKEKLHLITHGIDTDIFHRRNPAEIDAIKKRLGISSTRPILLSASRLIKQKGQEVVVEGLPEMVKALPDLLYIIVGGGPHQEVLEAMVNERGLQKNVLFAGGVDRTVLSEYLAICDLFVLPSQFYESFGLVYLEAAACGKTAIAGNRGGTNEAIVDQVTGFLVNPVSKDEIIDKVLQVLQDEQLRQNLQTSAFNRTVEEFSNVRMAEKLINI